MSQLTPDATGTAWIDALPDEQCMEIFWLYVDPPEPFLERYPPSLLGAALRYALKQIAEQTPLAADGPGSRAAHP